MNLLTRSLALVAWGVAALGCLRMHRLDLGLDQVICGPWGCGPSTESLLSLHGFWLLMMVPTAAWLASVIPPAVAMRVGLAIAGGSLIATIGYVVWDGVHFDQTASSYAADYRLQRGLFAVATLVDVPLVESTLSGALMFAVARHRCRVPVQPLVAY